MQISEIAFEHNKKYFVWGFNNNLDELGLDIENAFEAWVYRLQHDEFSTESFCKYVTSKDPINTKCKVAFANQLTYQEYKTRIVWQP